MKNFKLKNIIYYLLGTSTLSFGIALALSSELGAGAFDAMSANLAKLLNITIGFAFYLSFIVLFGLIMILKPRKNYFIGFLLTIIISFQIDIYDGIIPDINLLTFRIFYFALALLLLPFGVALIIKSKIPIGPIDNLLLILTEKLKWRISVVKTLIEGSFAILALIFGLSAGIGTGALYVGTIIMTLIIGPGIGMFLKIIKDI